MRNAGESARKAVGKGKCLSREAAHKLFPRVLFRSSAPASFAHEQQKWKIVIFSIGFGTEEEAVQSINDHFKIELEETKTIHSLLQTVLSEEEKQAAQVRARAATYHHFAFLQKWLLPQSPPVSLIPLRQSPL